MFSYHQFLHNHKVWSKQKNKSGTGTRLHSGTQPHNFRCSSQNTPLQTASLHSVSPQVATQWNWSAFRNVLRLPSQNSHFLHPLSTDTIQSSRLPFHKPPQLPRLSSFYSPRPPSHFHPDLFFPLPTHHHIIIPLLPTRSFPSPGQNSHTFTHPSRLAVSRIALASPLHATSQSQTMRLCAFWNAKNPSNFRSFSLQMRSCRSFPAERRNRSAPTEKKHVATTVVRWPARYWVRFKDPSAPLSALSQTERTLSSSCDP